MKNLVVAAIGAAAIGLFAAAGPASAIPLSAAGAAVRGSAASVPLAEPVAWRTVCQRRPVWRGGMRVWVRDCNRVWVGPPRPYAGSYRGPRYWNNGYYYRDRAYRYRIY
ncbi:hypothetical protein [Ancylobacter lacus]|uniref:hypothetical protein n=1 Tax=Ancylobacter lacus TaxID=2579970 RepID=UPI001BCB2E9D|nr:hypothetical protein [Ancylobacter lacus]MBS7537410.1 hypothetical protein [Ancylobacter lacus]